MNDLKTKLKTLRSKKAWNTKQNTEIQCRKIRIGYSKIILILSVRYFPESWNIGIIPPIFKISDKFDPQNYRGICHQLYGQSALQHYHFPYSWIPQWPQWGFMPNHHTSDHIFTLTTLIKTHVHRNKNKMYSCLVDFKKAFDSIWHEGLFYRLLESGMGVKPMI